MTSDPFDTVPPEEADPYLEADELVEPDTPPPSGGPAESVEDFEPEDPDPEAIIDET